jgi:hypothetical protein
MLLVGHNLFMGWFVYLIFDIQWPPSLGENWGVVTSPWTRHKTWWTSVFDRATGGLEITDRMPPFEPSWSTVFDRIVASSSYMASFFTDVAVLVMCSIWKDHPMASIFVFYALKFLCWITGLPSIKNSFISCIDLSWLPSFSGEWWSKRTCSRLCASSSLKLQSCPEVTWNQSDMCSNRHMLLYDAGLSSEEIDRFIAHLFDRGVPTAHPSSVSMPYNSNKPPPLVRVLDFFKSFPDPWSYESILIIHQDLYSTRSVDAELSDSNHDG